MRCYMSEAGTRHTYLSYERRGRDMRWCIRLHVPETLYVCCRHAAATSGVRSRMLTYADVCGRMLTHADVFRRMMTYVWRTLTYADVYTRQHTSVYVGIRRDMRRRHAAETCDMRQREVTSLGLPVGAQALRPASLHSLCS